MIEVVAIRQMAACNNSRPRPHLEGDFCGANITIYEQEFDISYKKMSG